MTPPTVPEARAALEDALRSIERHHIALNEERGRDPARSHTLGWTREALASVETIIAAVRTEERQSVAEAAEAVESAFREGFHEGMLAGHDLTPPRERDSNYHWPRSDAYDFVQSLNRADARLEEK